MWMLASCIDVCECKYVCVDMCECKYVCVDMCECLDVCQCKRLALIDTCECRYSLLHCECHLISISNLNLLRLFSTERGKINLESKIID